MPSKLNAFGSTNAFQPDLNSVKMTNAAIRWFWFCGAAVGSPKNCIGKPVHQLTYTYSQQPHPPSRPSGKYKSELFTNVHTQKCTHIQIYIHICIYTLTILANIPRLIRMDPFQYSIWFATDKLFNQLTPNCTTNWVPTKLWVWASRHRKNWIPYSGQFKQDTPRKVNFPGYIVMLK